MHTLSFDKPINFIWQGIFSAAGPDWMHISRALHEYELFIVTSGTLYIGDEHREYCVSEGEFLLMAPTSRQYGSRPSQCAFHWLHFLVPENTVSESTAAVISVPETDVIPDLSRFMGIVHQLYYAQQQGYGQDAYNYLFSSLLFELDFQLKAAKPASNPSLSLQKEELCKQIKAYIRFNALENIKIGTIAKHFGYHEKYLSTVFKATVGIGLKVYLVEEKMTLAKDMLLNSTYSVSQIAQTLGYSDVHTFSHAFKKALGLSPRDFRNAFYVCYD